MTPEERVRRASQRIRDQLMAMEITPEQATLAASRLFRSVFGDDGTAKIARQAAALEVAFTTGKLPSDRVRPPTGWICSRPEDADLFQPGPRRREAPPRCPRCGATMRRGRWSRRAQRYALVAQALNHGGGSRELASAPGVSAATST